MAQHPCKAETRCKDPTKTLEECPNKEDQMLATNPECTDAHQQSNPNKKNGCDSNMIPNATEGAKLNFGDEKKLSERYLKMRAYSRAQNCQYVGEAALTQGVKGGYNADALMIADPRKAKDGRGSTENPVFRYPGAKATAPSSEAGYGAEAEQYLERKSSEQDNLRQPDLTKISEFNANKNNTRTEVTKAALIKDPVCGALANRFDCKKSCLTASRSQCMLMSSQCAYTEGLTCKKSVQRGKRCFKKVCNDKTLDFQKGQCPRAYTEMDADCEKEADAVTRSIPMESIQDCKDGEYCPGMCVHYEPTKKEGKVVVEGAKTYKRETKTECLDKEENVVQCRNGAAMNPDVVEERIVPITKETCYGKDNKEVDCKDGEGYADYVQKILVDDGNPFFMIQKMRNGEFFQETQIDRSGTVSGKCDFLELEQLKTAYDCCMKKKDTSPLVSYYQLKAGIAEPAATTEPATTAGGAAAGGAAAGGAAAGGAAAGGAAAGGAAAGGAAAGGAAAGGAAPDATTVSLQSF